ncbi:MAG TPA: hypothetical protein PLV58_02580 [Campylobacterales bacterium]|nr:hypothetical protein [Campylobacterales bacterium]
MNQIGVGSGSGRYKDWRPARAQEPQNNDFQSQTTHKGVSADSTYYEFSDAYRVTFSKEALSLYGKLLEEDPRPVVRLTDRDYKLMDSVQKALMENLLSAD